MIQNVKRIIMSTLTMGLVGFSLVAVAQTTVPPTPQEQRLTESKALGDRTKQAQKLIDDSQAENMRSIANYDAYTPTGDATEGSFLGARKAFCGGEQICSFKDGQGQDLLANTLLDPYGYNDEQEKAAKQFIRNLTNPIPAGYDKSKYETLTGGINKEGIDFFARLYQKMPQITMAQNSLYAIWSERKRWDQMGQGLGISETDKASVLELMYYEVKRTYMDKDWYNMINASMGEELLKQMNYQMAYANYVSFKQYETLLRIEALLATSGNVFGNLGAQVGEIMKEAEEAEKDDEGNKKTQQDQEKEGQDILKGGLGIGGG